MNRIPRVIRLILALITLTGLIAAAGLARAQANTSTGPGAIEAGIENSGLLNATNYSFELYGTYAPSLPKHLGAGILAVYNVNDFVGVGIGADELGRFNMLSANATLQLPIYPLTFIHTSFTSNFAIVPFQLMGAAVPLSGASGSNGGILTEDTGAYFKFGELWGGQFDTGAAYGQWANAGAYSGKRYHIFFGWVKNF